MQNKSEILLGQLYFVFLSRICKSHNNVVDNMSLREWVISDMELRHSFGPKRYMHERKTLIR